MVSKWSDFGFLQILRKVCEGELGVFCDSPHVSSLTRFMFLCLRETSRSVLPAFPCSLPSQRCLQDRVLDWMPKYQAHPNQKVQVESPGGISSHFIPFMVSELRMVF